MPSAEKDVPPTPDGLGLPDGAPELIAESQSPVHLRLRQVGKYPRTACGAGLGQWWTGKVVEVTCPECTQAAQERRS